MNRREFVGVSAAALFTACASLATTTVTPVGGRVRLALRDHPSLAGSGGFLKIRPAESDRLIYVLALDDGGFAAVSPVCKHRGCIVDVAGARLECPCHGSMYGRDGRVLRGPTQAPLDRFPTTFDGAVLTITLNEA